MGQNSPESSPYGGREIKEVVVSESAAFGLLIDTLTETLTQKNTVIVGEAELIEYGTGDKDSAKAIREAGQQSDRQIKFLQELGEKVLRGEAVLVETLGGGRRIFYVPEFTEESPGR